MVALAFGLGYWNRSVWARVLINGILYGLGAAMPIGPVNVEIARRSLRSGFAAGAALGCGAVTIDVIYAILATLGVARFTGNPWVFWPIALAGVAILVMLGTMSLRGARSAGRGQLLAQSAAPSIRSGYLTGLAMTASNPMTLAFWFTVLPTVAGTLAEDPRRDLPLICLGVFIGTIGWVVIFTGLMSFAGRFRQPWWMTAADEAGGVVLLFLAGVAFLRVVEASL